MRRLQRFSIHVAHPKSGVESHVYIHAVNMEAATKKVNAAGLLIHSIEPVPEEETSQLYAEPVPPAQGAADPLAPFSGY